MTTYDPYNSYWHDRFDRPFAGYPIHDRAMRAPVIPAPKPRSNGKGAALGALLVGTIGVGAALAVAVFDDANSHPASTAIVLPGPATNPATPAAPGVVSPVVVGPGPASVAIPPDDVPAGVAAPPDNAPTTTTINIPQPPPPPPAPAPGSNPGDGNPGFGNPGGGNPGGSGGGSTPSGGGGGSTPSGGSGGGSTGGSGGSTPSGNPGGGNPGGSGGSTPSGGSGGSGSGSVDLGGSGSTPSGGGQACGSPQPCQIHHGPLKK